MNLFILMPAGSASGSASGSESLFSSTSDIMGVRDFFFAAGTQPVFQMCLNISINDDPFLEPVEIFSICGTSQQNAVVILNGGCTNIFIRDNESTKIDSKNSFIELSTTLILYLTVSIFPPSPNGVYTVEVQRSLTVVCTGSDPSNIVAWIRKPCMISSSTLLLNFILVSLCVQLKVSTRLQWA